MAAMKRSSGRIVFYPLASTAAAAAVAGKVKRNGVARSLNPHWACHSTELSRAVDVDKGGPRRVQRPVAADENRCRRWCVFHEDPSGVLAFR